MRHLRGVKIPGIRVDQGASNMSNRRTLTIALGLSFVASAAFAAEVRYYPVPKGSRPHDVAPAPDGSVWYTAQPKGELGRLDPKTGKTEHIALGMGSAPHGVIVGPDGAAWVTDGGQNPIGAVDPPTKAVKGYPPPAGRRYPHLHTAAL